MQSTALLATFTLILIVKIINGQQNSVDNQNFETNSISLQQQPTHALADSVQKLLMHNNYASALPNVNQYQAQTQTNPPGSLPSTHTIELPPDLQQQMLKVHHYLQLQQSEPQIKTSQQPLQAHQLILSQQAQPRQLLPSKPTLQQQPTLTEQTFQPQQLLPSQQTLQSQQLIQSQQALQSQQLFPSQDTLQRKQPVQLQQHTIQPQKPLQSQQPVQLQQGTIQPQQSLQSPQSLQSQHILQTQKPLQTQQTLHFPPQSLNSQPLLGFHQNSSPPKSIPAPQQNNNCQTNPQIRFSFPSSKPQTTVNSVRPLNMQNYIFQPQQNSFMQPAEESAYSQQSSTTLKEIPSIRYHIASQSPPSSPSNTPVDTNAIAIVPSYNIKSVEQKFIPESYPNNINFVPETPSSVVENTKATNPVLTTPTVVPIPSIPVQNNPRTYFYNQQPSDQWRSVYVNQNPGFRYTQQSQLPVTTVQSHTAVLNPSQSPIISPYPVSLVQAPSLPVFPQYTMESGYPVNTMMVPAYSTQRTKSSNLKSLLPLIFNLLKEKIASSGCSDCPCECKNKSNIDNEPEVFCGYSSQKNYGAINEETLSVLNAVSEETEGTECLRERKNCVKNANVTQEVSSETLEDEDSEEVVDEDDEEN